jgi:hypothetical protein
MHPVVTAELSRKGTSAFELRSVASNLPVMRFLWGAAECRGRTAAAPCGIVYTQLYGIAYGIQDCTMEAEATRQREQRTSQPASTSRRWPTAREGADRRHRLRW